MARARKKTSKVAKTYEPSERERAVLDANLERSQSRRPLPRLRLDEAESVDISICFEHENHSVARRLMLETIGSENYDFLIDHLDSLVDGFDVRKTKDVASMNFAISFVQGVEPQDKVEALLAAQMAVTYSALMGQSRRQIKAGRLDHA